VITAFIQVERSGAKFFPNELLHFSASILLILLKTNISSQIRSTAVLKLS